MINPLVSFIIPYFNAGSTIQETIDSIFNQSYPNFDIWLINDGSTDPLSIEKLKTFEGNEKIHVLHQENAGPSSARNAAIVKSTTDFYVLIDSDDLIEEDAISFALQRIEGYDVLFGDCLYFGVRNDIKKQRIPTLDEILIANPIAVCTIIRASVFDDVLFDPELNKLGLEDWEFWIHLFSKNYKFAYFEKIMFRIRVNDNSRTFQVANKNLEKTKKYIVQKHAEILYVEYNRIFKENKDLKNVIDFKIGRFMLSPYRYLKQKIRKNGKIFNT